MTVDEIIAKMRKEASEDESTPDGILGQTLNYLADELETAITEERSRHGSALFEAYSQPAERKPTQNHERFSSFDDAVTEFVNSGEASKYEYPPKVMNWNWHHWNYFVIWLFTMKTPEEDAESLVRHMNRAGLTSDERNDTMYSEKSFKEVGKALREEQTVNNTTERNTRLRPRGLGRQASSTRQSSGEQSTGQVTASSARLQLTKYTPKKDVIKAKKDTSREDFLSALNDLTEKADAEEMSSIADALSEDLDNSGIEFSTENCTCDPKESFNMPGFFVGLDALQGGTPIMWFGAGGDWEQPIAFCIYLGEDNNIHAYVPREGNCYNKDKNAAFGNVVGMCWQDELELMKIEYKFDQGKMREEASSALEG